MVAALSYTYATSRLDVKSLTAQEKKRVIAKATKFGFENERFSM